MQNKKISNPTLSINSRKKKFVEKTHRPWKQRSQGFEFTCGTGSLSVVLKESKLKQHEFVFSMDAMSKEDKLCKQYCSAPSAQQFFKDYALCPRKNFYEIIRQDKPMRLFFDLEHYGEDTFLSPESPSVESLKNVDIKVKTSLIFFLEKFLAKSNRSDLLTSINPNSVTTATSKKRKKTSCHIIFCNILFHTGLQLKIFIDNFLDFIVSYCPLDEVEAAQKELLYYIHPKTGKKCCVIDALMYHQSVEGTQNLRLVGSWKLGVESSVLRFLD